MEILLCSKKNKETRLSIQMNNALTQWMKKANVPRKQRLYNRRWVLEGTHIEAVNAISIEGSLMVSAADDGTLIIHDLFDTFVDNQGIKSDENAPIQLAQIDKLHGGRMVNSCCLSKNYNQYNAFAPSLGLFLVSSGADNSVHCLSLLDILRDSIRKQHCKNKVVKKNSFSL